MTNFGQKIFYDMFQQNKWLLSAKNYDEFRPEIMTNFGEFSWRDELTNWTVLQSEVGVSRLSNETNDDVTGDGSRSSRLT